MTTIARTLVVHSVEPGISDPGRVHAVVAVRDPSGSDGALHLFTSDPALAACLVEGAELEIRGAFPAEPGAIGAVA